MSVVSRRVTPVSITYYVRHPKYGDVKVSRSIGLYTARSRNRVISPREAKSLWEEVHAIYSQSSTN